jgi:multidrug resistance efflux pump
LASEIDIFEVPTGRFLETLPETRSKSWQTILDEYASAGPVRSSIASVAEASDVATTEAELSEAQRSFNRTEMLVKKGFQSQSQLEVARKLVETAQARLHTARRGYKAHKRLLQIDVDSQN